MSADLVAVAPALWARWEFWGAGITALLGMEVWSLVMHRWLWHGPLWWGHRSHHARELDGPASEPTAPEGWRARLFARLERNDLFAVVHALIAAPMVYVGLRDQLPVMAGLGFGMTAFGACYALVHDGLVHGRLPVAFLARVPWLRRVRNAHLAHHGKDPHRAPYGLFLGPWEVRRAQRQMALQRSRATTRASEREGVRGHRALG